MSALLLMFALHVVAPPPRGARAMAAWDRRAASPVRAIDPPASLGPRRPFVAPRRGARVLAFGGV